MSLFLKCVTECYCSLCGAAGSLSVVSRVVEDLDVVYDDYDECKSTRDDGSG